MDGSQGGRSSFASFHAEPFRLGYRRWLDGLRGVAIALVLAFHLKLLPGGSLGVDVFFVLSGFLITSILLEEFERRGSVRLGSFYARRALRLFPALIALLAVCAALTIFCHQDALGEIFVAAAYASNWSTLHRTPMPRLGHTWSLSVEEQFYLVWPIVLVGLLRLRTSKARTLAIVGALILASALLRVCLYRHAAPADKPATVMRLYMGSDTRADALLIGCAAAMLVTWRLVDSVSKRSLAAAAFGGVAILCYASLYRCLDHSQYYHGLFTVVAGAVAVAIVHQTLAPSALGQRILELGPLVWLGRTSYGLYLWHVPVIHWLEPIELGWSHPGPTILVAGLTCVAAGVSYVCIERPFLRLKKRFEMPRELPALPTRAAA